MIIRFLDENIMATEWHARSYEVLCWLKENVGEITEGWHWNTDYRYVNIDNPEIAALFILKYRV